MPNNKCITKDDIIAAIAENLDAYGIMEKFGVNKDQIRYCVNKNNILIPNRFYFNKTPRDNTGYIKAWTDERKKAASIALCGENNPFFGKIHSDKTREQMRVNHADFNGDNNPFRKALIDDPSKVEEHKQRCKSIWANRDNEYRRNFGEKQSLIQSHSKRAYSNKRHHSGYYDSIKGGRVYFRSSWELSIIQSLDVFNHIESFIVEPFAIKYNYRNTIRHTTPDILITFRNGAKVLIEIKPDALQLEPLNVARINCYKEYCKANNIKFLLCGKEYQTDESAIFVKLLELYTEYSGIYGKIYE